MRPWQEERFEPDLFALPIQGKPERVHLYRWIADEEVYVADKFDDQRDGHDESMKTYDLEDFWIRQVIQYYDRAQQFFQAARTADEGRRRFFEMKGQQALAKAMMTAKGCVESSIRCFGNMPLPGVESGDVREWT